MKSLNIIGLALLFFAQPSLSGFSQSGIITTYVGPQLPVNGALATTQAIDHPSSVVPDSAGGFYVASVSQNRVYRVAADGQLSLVAGVGPNGFSGDGGPPPSAQLNGPSAVAVDTAGNIYIADKGNNRIRKVTAAGVITTVAGNGTQGFSGDGGQANSTQLNGPSAVAVDTAGNLYIADYGNNRIRKVTAAGVITTIAGNGIQGFSGDGGPATSARLHLSLGVAVDSMGNLYIADSGNYRIRKVTSAGTISTIAGNGSAGISCADVVEGKPAISVSLQPQAMAVDTAGTLFVVDGCNRVHKLTNAGIIIATAGSGDGVAVDVAGNLYLSDSSGNRVWKVTPAGLISVVAGDGTRGFSGDGGAATSARLNNADGLAVDRSGNLFIADSSNYRVRKVTPGGVISTIAGNGTRGFSGDGGPATAAQLYGPAGVALDAAGNLYINEYCRIRRVTPDGVINSFAGNGTCGYSGDGGPAYLAQFAASDIAVDASGNLFLADNTNRRVRKVTPGGLISTVAGNGIKGFSGDDGPATAAQLSSPGSIGVDAAGSVYIADSDVHRIRKITASGIISTVAGFAQGFSGDGGPATSAQLNWPAGISIDSEGNLYIADSFNNRIRKVAPGGVISTVAGNGTQGFSGDGGPATSAQLYYPNEVAADAAGNFYIGDQYNNRIRRVAAAGTSVPTFFPQVAVGNGYSTRFTLGNTGATPISGTLSLKDPQGYPFIVSGLGFGAGSSFPITIPTGGTSFLTINSLTANDPQKSGWAIVETSGGSLSGVATYEFVSQGIMKAAAGVLPSQPIQFATIPVDNDDSQLRFTGYAMANPSDQSLIVKLGVVDQDGALVDDTVAITLGPRQQTATFLHQDLSRFLKFKGSMVLRAQAGGSFVVVALLQKQQVFTVVPVTPAKAPNIPN